MREYESVCVLKPDLNEEQIEAHINKLKEVITNNGGIINKVERWGKKRLSYEIRKYRHGNYIFFYLEGPPSLIPELERNYKLNEDVLRYLTVRHEKGSTLTATFDEREESSEGE